TGRRVSGNMNIELPRRIRARRFNENNLQTLPAKRNPDAGMIRTLRQPRYPDRENVAPPQRQPIRLPGGTVADALNANLPGIGRQIHRYTSGIRRRTFAGQQSDLMPARRE